MVQVSVRLREGVFHNYIFKEIGESFVFNILVMFLQCNVLVGFALPKI